MDFPRTVYAIKHNKTGRVYIGSSKRPVQRVEQHMSDLRGGRHSVEDMQADFNTYGQDYTVEFLEVITKFSDRSHEYEWMRKYNSGTRGVGYNYKDRSMQERKINPVVEYRREITELLRETKDIEALDFVCQYLRKMVSR